MLRFPFPGRTPFAEPRVPVRAQQRFRHELTVKWPNPSGAKRWLSWHLPHGGRFEIGTHVSCQASIPGFAWSRFLLFIQDSLNDHGIDLHLLEGMRAEIVSPLETFLLGPTRFRKASWSGFQQHWTFHLPEACCGRLIIAETALLFQRNHYPYKHLSPYP